MYNTTIKLKPKNYYKLYGGIIDPNAVKKSKKIANKLQKLKHNSDKTQAIAQKSIKHLLDIANNTTDITQSIITNAYRILAPNNKQILQKTNKKYKLKPNKKTKKHKKHKKYTNEWDLYNK